MQTLLNSMYKNYKKDGDKDEVEDGVKQLFIIAKNNEIPMKKSKSKIVDEIIKNVEEEKKKDEETKKQQKPPRPSKPPQFVFKGGKLVLVSLLEKRKQRPAKPTREAPKKIEDTHKMPNGDIMTGGKHEADSKPLVVIDDKPKKKKNVPFVPQPKVDYKKQVIDKYDLKIGSRIKLGDSQGDEVAVVKELGANKMRVSTEIGNVILTFRYNRVEIEKMIAKKMKDKKGVITSTDSKGKVTKLKMKDKKEK